MEKILKKQTKEQILNDFKKLKNLNYNLEEYVPSFYKDTINLFQEDIKELERLSSSKTTKSVFINKLIFKKENINNIDDFREFILKNKPNIKNIKLYKDFEKRLNDFYNYIKTDIGGRCVELFYIDTTNNTYPSTKLIIGNAYRNPFDTMHTIFHEFCHAIQFKYDVNKYSYLHTIFSEKEKYSDLEYNKLLRDYYINYLYITETEADLFGFFILLIKSLISNKNTIIIYTIKQIENILFKQKQFSIFRGYFSYPIVKDYLYNKEKLNKLRKFIGKNNKIDILKLKNFTKELTLNKQQEYYEDLFKDNDYDYSLFDIIIKQDIKEVKVKTFVEKNTNKKFVNDYLEYKNITNKPKMDDIFVLENKILNLIYKTFYYNQIKI